MKREPLLGFESLKHVHIVGVCGTLMGAFAAFLRDQGIRVTGSDQNVYPPMSDVLEAAGVELFSPYSAENLDRISQGRDQTKPDLYVIGNVVSQSNVEMQAIQKRGDPYVSLPEFMETHLLPHTRNLVAAGTHGKTTTSSILAHVLVQNQSHPSYFIGGVSPSFPRSFHVQPGSQYFVLEGDEYDTAFWDKVPKFNHYLPDDVILTSVEFDHADIYENLEAILQAFRGLIQRIRPGGRLIACVESENVRQLLQDQAAVIEKNKIRVQTYSRFKKDHADYTIDSLSVKDGMTHVKVGGAESFEFKMQLSGEHNALNALAVFVLARDLDLSSEQICAGMASFRGIKRRQEERGEVNGVLVIDDFAHHPTAVKETLQALKMRYPGRKHHVIFEPRSATSRRKIFQKEYTEAFDSADCVYIAQAYDQSKIPSSEAFSSEELVTGLMNRGKEAAYFREVDEGVKQVTGQVKSGDLVSVLSNGGFGGFIPKLLKALEEKHS